MTTQDYDDIVVFETHIELDEAGLSRRHLTEADYYKRLYKKALERLSEQD